MIDRQKMVELDLLAKECWEKITAVVDRDKLTGMPPQNVLDKCDLANENRALLRYPTLLLNDYLTKALRIYRANDPLLAAIIGFNFHQQMAIHAREDGN